MMEWEKQLHQFADRLNYLKDIFPDKHEEDIRQLVADTVPTYHYAKPEESK